MAAPEEIRRQVEGLLKDIRAINAAGDTYLAALKKHSNNKSHPEVMKAKAVWLAARQGLGKGV